eukprot:9480577-Pyramimonas_sp.AAC.1
MSGLELDTNKAGLCRADRAGLPPVAPAAARSTAAPALRRTIPCRPRSRTIDRRAGSAPYDPLRYLSVARSWNSLSCLLVASRNFFLQRVSLMVTCAYSTKQKNTRMAAMEQPEYALS